MTTLGTMVVVKALLAFRKTMVPAVAETTPSVRVLVPEIVVKAPVLAVVPPMAPGVVSAVAMSAVAIARYAGKPVVFANSACVAVTPTLAVTTTVPDRLGRSMVLLTVAAFPRKVVRVPVFPSSMLPVPVVVIAPPPPLVSMLPPA